MRPSPHAAPASPLLRRRRMTNRRSCARRPRWRRPPPSIRTRRKRPCARKCPRLLLVPCKPHRRLRRALTRKTLPTPGPGAAYAPTLQAPSGPLTGPDGTQVLSNRLVGSLEDAGEGHHGPLEPGSIIKKRFVLETLLGKGGMGLVFGAIDRRKEEARDPNPRVALKVLNADFQRHPQAFMALQREARKAQTLAHPNVVTVFDFDRDGDAVYMTMELLEGPRARLDDARSARQGHQARRCAADHSRHRRRSRVRASQGHRAFGPEARQRLHHRGRHARRFSTSASRAQCRA